MTLLQLQYFIAVYEIGNVTKAANALYVSQPTVTRSLHALEEAVGSALFRYNEQKRLVPTAAGEIVYEHAKSALRSLDNMMTHVREAQTNLNEPLVIMVGATTNVSFSGAFCQFRKTHPNINLRLVEVSGLPDVSFVNSPQPVDGVLMRKSLMREEMDSFDAAFICTSERGLYVSPTSSFAAHRAIKAEMKSDKPIIVSGVPKDKSSLDIPELLPLMGGKPTYSISDQLLTSLTAVINGEYYLYEDRMFCPNNQNVVWIPFDPPVESSYYLYSHNNQMKKPALKQLIEFLRNYDF